MPDPQLPPNQDTPASDPATPAPATLNAEVVDALRSVVDYVKAQQAIGNTSVVAETASKVGWTPDELQKMIDDSYAAGRPGEGVLKTVGTIVGTMKSDADIREGKREVAGLVNHRELGEAFSEHKPKFDAFLKQQGVSMAALAEPGRAEEVFKYYLTNFTDHHKKKRDLELDKARLDERKKVEEEMSLRTRRPAADSLPTGARTEGGALRSLVKEAIGASEEPSDRQFEIMRNFGFDDDKIKRAMKSHSAKTAMGTPLDFIIIRNEGGV
jgi:hypothetical protein